MSILPYLEGSVSNKGQVSRPLYSQWWNYLLDTLHFPA